MRYMLYEANEGDIVCYCDSRYQFKSSIVNFINNLVQSPPHIAIPKNKPGEGEYKEKWFSKGDALTIIDADSPSVRESLQAWAGFNCFKKTFYAIQFIAQWMTYVEDARVMIGHQSILAPNDDEFKASRQDQSALSLVGR